MDLETRLSLEKIQDSDNINKLLTEDDSRNLGLAVKQAFLADKSSRMRWEENMRDAENLALQITEPKSYPWDDASNVKFPLITIAATQFAARAYPALVKAPDLVKYRVQGKDEGGLKAARAARVSRHMSYQLLEEDEEWEENHDKALLALPILGCVFKKSYYDKTKGYNCSTLVLPKNLVIHYFARSVDQCERKTEVFQLSPREIKERELRGIFSKVDLPTALPIVKDEDKRQGVTAPPPDKDQARDLLEHHCFLDLDGDGYKEPYVVTIDRDTSKVLRVVHRFKKVTTEQSVKIEELQKRIKAFAEGVQQPQDPQNPTAQEIAYINSAEQTILKMQAEVERLSQEKPKVLKIDPVEYYTKIPFIPSPDGGIYDLGFGALLGPLNESVNTLINQLIDAGHMSSGAVGFIGKGARLKGGDVRFRPFEFKKVNSAGGAIRDAIVQLDIASPSPVLFQLLSLLITYSERVGSVTDAMVGENPGQNTPAYNMSAMLEQGLQVFNGIFKRVYRSMRSEFRKLYELNSLYLDEEAYFAYQDMDTKVLRTDYHGDTKDLIPAADPNAFSNKEKAMKAQMISERAMMVPGYDPTIVEKRWLAAMEVVDVDELYPMVEEQDEQGNKTGNMVLKYPPQPDPELEIQKADLQRQTLADKSNHDIKVKETEVKMMVAEAQVIKLMADAQVAADKPTLERLKIQLEDMVSKREAMTQVAVAEIGAKKVAKGTSK